MMIEVFWDEESDCWIALWCGYSVVGDTRRDALNAMDDLMTMIEADNSELELLGDE